MSFAILPQGKPITLISKDEEEKEQGFNQKSLSSSSTYQIYNNDIIFQSFFNSIFPSLASKTTTKKASTKNNKKWYVSIIFFPLWVGIYIVHTCKNKKWFISIFPSLANKTTIYSKENEEWYDPDSLILFPLWICLYIFIYININSKYNNDNNNDDELLHANTSTTTEESNDKIDKLMVQSRKLDSSFLTFHLLSKKRYPSNVIFEKFSSSNTSEINGNNDDKTNVLILDYGKMLLFSTPQEEKEAVVDISYTNDYQNLLYKLSKSQDDTLAHTRIVYIPTKKQCIISWGGLDEYGYVYIYQYIHKSNRSNQNIGWKLISKLYPYGKNAIQVNNFVTEMIKLPDNKYEYIIVSRCNGILEIVPYNHHENKNYNSVGIDVSKYHYNITALDIFAVKEQNNKKYYTLIVSGISSMTNTNILTFYTIVIDTITYEILAMEFTNEITFADRVVSFFSPNKSSEDVSNNQPPEVMEMNVPILQVMFLNDTSTIGLLDCYGNVTILNLTYNIEKSKDVDDDTNNNGITIESTMVLSSAYNIIQMMISTNKKCLITITLDNAIDIYDIEQEKITSMEDIDDDDDYLYSCLFQYNFNNYCDSLLLIPSTIQEQSNNNMVTMILLQNDEDTNSTLQCSTISYMTNEESYDFYIKRNDYQSALSISISKHKKDLCYQKLWESRERNNLNTIYDSLQKYWLYITNQEYIYNSCLNIDFMVDLEDDDYDDLGYNILYIMYTTAIDKCIDYNIQPIQENYQKLFIYYNLSIYYKAVPSFSIKIFLTKVLSEHDIIQEFALQIAKSGDILPFMFIILYGYKRISNWYTIFNNLSLDISPNNYSFMFPIIDEYGTVGFVLRENDENDKISYSPIEIIYYLKQCYPSCTLWKNDNDNNIILNDESRIQVSIEEKNNIKQFYIHRIVKLMNHTQNLSFIIQQCNISKHRLSYFDNDFLDNGNNEDIVFISIIEKASYYLQQCLLHDNKMYGSNSSNISIQEFCNISIKTHITTILGKDDANNDILYKYSSLLVPILTNLYKVDTFIIQEHTIDHLMTSLSHEYNNMSKNNNHSLQTTLKFFEHSRTTLSYKQRIIYSPIQLIKLFLKVITIVSNSWVHATNTNTIKQQIDIIWKCYECLPVRYTIMSNHNYTEKQKCELDTLQDQLNDYYKFWIVIDILSRYVISSSPILPSISYMSSQYKNHKKKLLLNDIFPFLLNNFFSSIHNDNDNADTNATSTLFEEFLLYIIQVQYCILSDKSNIDDNKNDDEKENTMKTFVVNQTLPLLLQYKYWEYVSILMNKFQQYTTCMQSYIFQKIKQSLSTLSTINEEKEEKSLVLQELQGIIAPLFHNIQSLLLPEYKLMYHDIIRYMDFCYYMIHSIITSSTSSSTNITILPFEIFNNNDKNRILDWIYNITITQSDTILFHTQEYWLQQDEHIIRTCYNILSYRTTTTKSSLSFRELWYEFLLPGKKLFELLSYFNLHNDEADEKYDIIVSYFIFHTLINKMGKQQQQHYYNNWIALCCSMILMPSIVKYNDHPYLDAFWEDVMLLLTRLQEQQQQQDEMIEEQKNILLYYCRECLLHCNPIHNNSIRNPFIVLDIISNLEKRNVANSESTSTTSAIATTDSQQQQTQNNILQDEHNKKPANNFLVFKVGNLVAKGVTKMLSTDDEHHQRNSLTTNGLTTKDQKQHQQQQPIISIPKFPIPLIITTSYGHTQLSIQSIIIEFLQHYNLMNITSLTSSSSLYDYDWIIPYITALILTLQDLDEISSFLPNPLPSPPRPLPPKVIPKADPSIVQYLEGVGYTRTSAMKCAIMTQNQGCSQALEYAIHNDRNEDFTHPSCFVANTLHSSSSSITRQAEELKWKKQYRHYELVHRANISLTEFLYEGVLFITKDGHPIVSGNRDIATLSAVRSNIPPPLQPSINIQLTIPNIESSQHHPPKEVSNNIASLVTNSDIVKAHPPPSEVSKNQKIEFSSLQQQFQQQALSSTVASLAAIESKTKTTKVSPPPPPPPLTNILEKPSSSQQTVNKSIPATGAINTKIPKMRTPTPPPPPPTPKERNVSSAPSSISNKINTRPNAPPPPPPPPPKSLPGTRLKIDISQFKPKTPTVIASTKQLSIEERRRLAKEGRKIFLQARNNSNSKQSNFRDIKETNKGRQEKMSSTSNGNGFRNTTTTTATTTDDGWNFDDDASASSTPNTNGRLGDKAQLENYENTLNEKIISTSIDNAKCEGISKNCPPPTPLASNTATDDGWDFDDDDDSPAPAISSSSGPNDGWDFDDF